MSSFLVILGLAAVAGGAYMIHPGACVVFFGLVFLRLAAVVASDGGEG